MSIEDEAERYAASLVAEVRPENLGIRAVAGAAFQAGYEAALAATGSGAERDDRAVPVPDEEGRELWRREREAVHTDLVDILRALGIGDHARPYSSHDVVQREVLPAIRAIRAYEPNRAPTPQSKSQARRFAAMSPAPAAPGSDTEGETPR